MSTISTDQQHCQTIRLDGVKYHITVFESDNGDHRGQWHCPQCDRGDVSAVRLPDAEHAEQWARHCLSVHHSLVHAE